MAFVTMVAVSGCGKANTQDRTARPSLAPGVIARIGGDPVPLADLELRAAVSSLLSKEPVAAGDRKQLLDQLIVQRLLARDAKRQNLSVPEAEAADEYEVLQEALMENYQTADELDKRMKELKLTTEALKGWLGEFMLAQVAAKTYIETVTLTDAEMQVFYEQNKAVHYTVSEDMVRARHILLAAAEEAKAKDLLQQAKSGSDFATLARENSQDPGSGPQGGDLSYFRKGDMVPEFAELAFSLKAGEVGGPVKSQFGWHIIKVEDRRGPGVIPFEAAKSDITIRLLPAKQEQQFGNYIEGLKVTEQVQAADSP